MDSIKAIYFDLHGTLLLSDNVKERWEEWLQAFYHSFQLKGAKINLDDFRAKIENIFNGPEPQLNEKGLTLFERRVKTLGNELGLVFDNVELRNLVEKIIKVWHKGMVLDPETVMVLEKLRTKYDVGMITNWEHTPRIYELLDELNANHLFNHVIISDEINIAKPHLGIFMEALSRCGLKPEEMAYVGDMAVDIEGSSNAGLLPILIRRENDNGDWAYYDTTRVELKTENVTVIKKLSQLLDLFPCDG